MASPAPEKKLEATPPRVIIVMGVSGSGKTTIGKNLARDLGWQFADADEHHSPQNIEKMAHGIPLTDQDRAPWLAELHRLIESWVHNNTPGVLACSALKRKYRDQLRAGPQVAVVFLAGTFELFESRLRARTNHYFKASLLKSQFETLEPPTRQEHALQLDAGKPPEKLVADIRAALSV